MSVSGPIDGAKPLVTDFLPPEFQKLLRGGDEHVADAAEALLTLSPAAMSFSPSPRPVRPTATLRSSPRTPAGRARLNSYDYQMITPGRLRLSSYDAASLTPISQLLEFSSPLRGVTPSTTRLLDEDITNTPVLFQSFNNFPERPLKSGGNNSGGWHSKSACGRSPLDKRPLIQGGTGGSTVSAKKSLHYSSLSVGIETDLTELFDKEKAESPEHKPAVASVDPPLLSSAGMGSPQVGSPRKTVQVKSNIEKSLEQEDDTDMMCEEMDASGAAVEEEDEVALGNNRGGDDDLRLAPDVSTKRATPNPGSPSQGGSPQSSPLHRRPFGSAQPLGQKGVGLSAGRATQSFTFTGLPAFALKRSPEPMAPSPAGAVLRLGSSRKRRRVSFGDESDIPTSRSSPALGSASPHSSEDPEESPLRYRTGPPRRAPAPAGAGGVGAAAAGGVAGLGGGGGGAGGYYSREASVAAAARAVAAAFALPSEAAAGGGAGAPPPKPCNCLRSKCLKLYCDCFGAKLLCEGCNCADCHNDGGHEEARLRAIRGLLERRPTAFNDKIATTVVPAPAVVLAGGGAAAAGARGGGAAPGGAHARGAGGGGGGPGAAALAGAAAGAGARRRVVGEHAQGCNCKRSACLKKYCECFTAGAVCGANCKCENCENFPGSQGLQRALAKRRLEAPPGNPPADPHRWAAAARARAALRQRRGPSPPPPPPPPPGWARDPLGGEGARAARGGGGGGLGEGRRPQPGAPAVRGASGDPEGGGQWAASRQHRAVVAAAAAAAARGPRPLDELEGGAGAGAKGPASAEGEEGEEEEGGAWEESPSGGSRGTAAEEGAQGRRRRRPGRPVGYVRRSFYADEHKYNSEMQRNVAEAFGPGKTVEKGTIMQVFDFLENDDLYNACLVRAQWVPLAFDAALWEK